VQKTLEALVLLDDCEEEDDNPFLEDSVQIYIQEQDKDEEQSSVPKATKVDMEPDFFRNVKLFDMDAHEPEPDVWKKGSTRSKSSSCSRSFISDQEILMLAVQHKPSASLPRNSKSKARAPAKALQTSESEGESSEAREMFENKSKKDNKQKQEKKNKKQSKKKQEKKKKKPTKDTNKKKDKKNKQNNKDEIEEKKDQEDKKDLAGKRKSFGGVKITYGPAKLRFHIMMVFSEVLVPKAASPKAAPWEAEWYKYSYHGAKHLKTKKGYRKFFLRKAREFLKEMGHGDAANSDSSAMVTKLAAEWGQAVKPSGRHGADPGGAIQFRDKMRGMWRQALKKLPGSEVSYDEFIQKLVAMCEKAFDVRKVTMQSDRNFLETCWDMDTKKSRDVSFEDWIAYSVDSFVDQEKEKKVSEQDKDKEKDKDKEEVKDEAPWRRHPPPLPMPPSDGARGSSDGTAAGSSSDGVAAENPVVKEETEEKFGQVQWKMVLPLTDLPLTGPTTAADWAGWEPRLLLDPPAKRASWAEQSEKAAVDDPEAQQTPDEEMKEEQHEEQQGQQHGQQQGQQQQPTEEYCHDFSRKQQQWQHHGQQQQHQEGQWYDFSNKGKKDDPWKDYYSSRGRDSHHGYDSKDKGKGKQQEWPKGNKGWEWTGKQQQDGQQQDRQQQWGKSWNPPEHPYCV
ncbi:unnamed protein product, partial [Symbiodinium microadriaticum]